MAIYMRGKTYWVDFEVGGKRTRVSTGTRDRKQAQELHDQLRAQAWRSSKLGEKPAHTWEEAALRWLREKAGKKDHEGDCLKIEFFNRHFAGLPLNEITSDRIYEVVETHKADVCGATRNRYLSLIRAMMRRAHREWKWLDANDVPHVSANKESSGRKRFLEPEELSRLLRELPEHLRDIAMLAVSTGLRMSNVVGLRWAWVNLADRTVTIPGELTKNGDDHAIPLNDRAIAAIQRQAGKHREYVFVYKGNPVKSVSGQAWYKALRRASLTDVRFHDLRRTFASYLIQQGASDRELQELGGWKSPTMLRRYAQLRVRHLAPAAGLIDRVLPADLLLTVAER